MRFFLEFHQGTTSYHSFPTVRTRTLSGEFLKEGDNSQIFLKQGELSIKFFEDIHQESLDDIQEHTGDIYIKFGRPGRPISVAIMKPIVARSADVTREEEGTVTIIFKRPFFLHLFLPLIYVSSFRKKLFFQIPNGRFAR